MIHSKTYTHLQICCDRMTFWVSSTWYASMRIRISHNFKRQLRNDVSRHSRLLRVRCVQCPRRPRKLSNEWAEMSGRAVVLFQGLMNCENSSARSFRKLDFFRSVNENSQWI